MGVHIQELLRDASVYMPEYVEQIWQTYMKKEELLKSRAKDANGKFKYLEYSAALVQWQCDVRQNTKNGTVNTLRAAYSQIQQV